MHALAAPGQLGMRLFFHAGIILNFVLKFELLTSSAVNLRCGYMSSLSLSHSLFLSGVHSILSII